MGVGELADQAQIKLDLGHECSGWLAAAPPRGASLRQLALLSHLAAKTLRAGVPLFSVPKVTVRRASNDAGSVQ